MQLFVLVVLALCCLSGVRGSAVIELTSSTFEHLTQATTGHTTGDWLVKFYAPWCGHCKTLAPVLEEVAQELTGITNVAKVDVMANRDLGTRFDIKGFPTVLFFSKGHLYTFKGKRTTEDLVEFVRGGYQVHEGASIPGELGYFGEIILVWKHAYKEAAKDLEAGNYFTVNVFLMVMPIIFGVAMLFVLFVPFSSPQIRAMEKAKAEAANARKVAAKTSEIPLSNRARPAVSSVDSHTSKNE